MFEKENISVQQFAILVFMFTIGSSILIISAPIVSEAKQDGWISALIAICFGMLIIYLYSALAKSYPQQTIVGMSDKILGPIGGKIFSFLYFTFTFLTTALVLNNMGSFMQSQIYIDTPISALNFAFIIFVIFAVSSGIEVIARCGEIFFPWVMFLCIFLVLLNIPNIDFKQLLPILEFGVKPIIRGTIPLVSIPFLELVSFLMILSSVKDSKTASKGFFIGGLVGSFVLFTVLLLSILVLGVSTTERQMYPTYTLGKKLSGKVLQRIEVIVAIIWIITMFFKTVILFYASVKSLAQIFSIHNYRLLLFPLGMLAMVLSLTVYPDVPYFLNFASKIWPLYALTFGLFLPLVLLLMNTLKKKKLTEAKDGPLPQD